MMLVSAAQMRHDGHVPTVIRTPALKRCSPWLLVLGGAITALACESEPIPVVHLNAGTRPEDHRSFQPKSSIAEYTELPGFGAELRVVLSSHPITCESYLPLAKDQVLVTLTFSVPRGAQLGPGSYPWSGTPPVPIPGTASTTAGGAAPDAEQPAAQVLPFVRMGKQSVELPPGGLVELTEVKLDAQGVVRGLLRLEQPGAAGLPATSLLGSFSARWCKISTPSGNELP